ncbi:GRAM domain-containing protein 2B isoform X1 [Anabrus simplex]|uniref:GRAM domain-containing protein 2B isoform X1 n=1 Tax=Anabrus simplex TaxID=316456 RepID=UPI0035A2D5E4
MSEKSISRADSLQLPIPQRPRSNSDNGISYTPLVDQDDYKDEWLCRPRTPTPSRTWPESTLFWRENRNVTHLLARSLLQLSAPAFTPPAPAPLVVEDPPSSEEDEELRSTARPSAAYLDGSNKTSTSSIPTSLSAVDETDEFHTTPSTRRRRAPPPPPPSPSIPNQQTVTAPSSAVPPIIVVNEDEEVDGSDSSAPSTPSPKSRSRSQFYLESSWKYGIYTGKSSSSILAKSAPSTPQGERLLQPTPRIQPVQKSPSHVFGRHDRQALKQLSASAPVMTQAQAAARPQPASEPVLTSGAAQEPGSSKSRQKKFHRHFKTVPPEERVLNYYSCALVGDILLQGHLYITKNYFAFYSNVFGYVTKLLIPTVSVLKVSKEKTARIIPNAIGVATGLEKHVFGSLLSRDSTYRLMMQVWKEAIAQGPKIPITITQVVNEVDSVSGDVNLPEDEDSSLSGSERSCPPTPLDCPTDLSHSETEPKLPNGSLVPGAKHILLLPKKSSSISRPTLLLVISTALLVLLFLSAAFLLYRIGRIHNQFVENPLLTSSDDIYQEILKWQTQLHSRSANEVQEFLNSNLDQLIKVRQSLEVLSQLIVMEGEDVVPQQGQQQQQEQQKKQDSNELPQDRHS